MKLRYSRRAIADLEAISAYYKAHASPAVAEAVGLRIAEVIVRITDAPNASPRLSQRQSLRVAAVVRYPYKIFYRQRGDLIDILHIRHTTRRPL